MYGALQLTFLCAAFAFLAVQSHTQAAKQPFTNDSSKMQLSFETSMAPQKGRALLPVARRSAQGISLAFITSLAASLAFIYVILQCFRAFSGQRSGGEQSFSTAKQDSSGACVVSCHLTPLGRCKISILLAIVHANETGSLLIWAPKGL